MVMEVVQPETEPLEGISTSPSTSRPTQVLCTHQQHTTHYVCLMVKAGISLPMGEGQSVALVTEVFPLFHSLLTSHASLYLASGPLPSFIHLCFLFSSRPSRKSVWLIIFVVWQSYCTQMPCRNWRLLYWDCRQQSWLTYFWQVYNPHLLCSIRWYLFSHQSPLLWSPPPPLSLLWALPTQKSQLNVCCLFSMDLKCWAITGFNCCGEIPTSCSELAGWGEADYVKGTFSSPFLLLWR